MREVGNRHDNLADLARELTHLLMGPLEKVLENAELVQQLER
jgi:hypothetical protein